MSSFTDLEDPAHIWEHRIRAIADALARHDKLVREVIEEHEGHIFKVVGDAFRRAFSIAASAPAAAESQSAVNCEALYTPNPITVVGSGGRAAERNRTLSEAGLGGIERPWCGQFAVGPTPG